MASAADLASTLDGLAARFWSSAERDDGGRVVVDLGGAATGDMMGGSRNRTRTGKECGCTIQNE